MKEIPMYFPFISGGDSLPDEHKRKRYTKLTLDAGDKAKAYPWQSLYYVLTGILAMDGTDYFGGNKEHALSDAWVHGETATLSGLRDITDCPAEALAWYEKTGRQITQDDYGCPCGACLDVLSAYCPSDLILLNGNETGIVATRLKDYLYNDFRTGNSAKISENQVIRADVAIDQAVDVYLPQEMKTKLYGAVLVGKDGTMWPGSLYTNAGFDAVPPIMSAVLHWKGDYPGMEVSEKHLNLEKLVVVGRGKIPDPLYRDRQAILELDEILRRWKRNDTPLPVELVSVDGKDYTLKETNVSEWLPHPFTPGTFRMDDVMQAELEKLVGKIEVNGKSSSRKDRCKII
jgi:cytidine deaminase